MESAMTDRELQDLRNLGHDDAADEIERLHAEVDSWSQQASDRAQDALDLVAAERERCAKICEQRFSDGALVIADAIRGLDA